MAPKEPKVKKGQPPPVDKLVKPAIGVGLALLAYQFLQGLQSEIRRVNVFDAAELSDVLKGTSGEKSYAVLCQDEDSNYISSVFQDAFNDKSHTADFRLLDCSYILPDYGKSIAEQYKLDVKKRPTIFLSGKAEPPTQVAAKHLKTGTHLVKYIRSKLEKRAAKIETTQDLRSKCLDKNICGLLLKGSKKAPQYLKDAMDKVLKEQPNVSFAAVDTSLLYVYNLEEYLPELTGEQPRFVVFQKVSGSTQSGKDRLKTSFAATEGVSYGTMSNLVADVITGKADMQPISSLPVIKTRSKKLVEEERLKRQRRHEQKLRQERGEAADDTPSGMFQANDGSKEGRRAERERRRAEHRKNNNVKDKTKEEIAEMERRRRERMEAEAAKWNAVPEDVPPKGDYLDENFVDDGSDETVVVEDAEETDDEDVIDLD